MPSYEFARPALTTDCAVFGLDDDDLKVLLIKRGPPLSLRPQSLRAEDESRLQSGNLTSFMKALLIIDLQNDFLPGGALGLADDLRENKVTHPRNSLYPTIKAQLNYQQKSSGKASERD